MNSTNYQSMYDLIYHFKTLYIFKYLFKTFLCISININLKLC